MRTTTTIVTFTRPFTLFGFDKPHPPGSFEVRTDEERLDTTFEAWLRVGTTILLSDRWGTQSWAVDPKELQDALNRDLDVEPEPGSRR